MIARDAKGSVTDLGAFALTKNNNNLSLGNSVLHFTNFILSHRLHRQDIGSLVSMQTAILVALVVLINFVGKIFFS